MAGPGAVPILIGDARAHLKPRFLLFQRAGVYSSEDKVINNGLLIAVTPVREQKPSLI